MLCTLASLLALVAAGAATTAAAVGLLQADQSVEFPPTSFGTLASVSLVRVDASSGQPDDYVYSVPQCWNYDGHGWEAAPGHALAARIGPSAVAVVDALVSCGSTPANPCVVPFPAAADNPGFRFRYDTYPDPADHATSRNYSVAERRAAKYLQQTSFGATRIEVGNLASELESAVAGESDPQVKESLQLAVLQSQLDVAMDPTTTPATLHRAYWRSRVNPRVQPGRGCVAGGVLGPCSPGSRWHR